MLGMFTKAEKSRKALRSVADSLFSVPAMDILPRVSSFFPVWRWDSLPSLFMESKNSTGRNT